MQLQEQDHQLEEMHVTIVSFISPSPLLDLINFDSCEEDGDNATVTKQRGS